MMMIEQHRHQTGTLPLCEALEIPRASFYRQQAGTTNCVPVVPRRRPEHALSGAEQQTVLATLHDPRFVDLAPSQVYAQLLEEGTYLCSIRTMYRLLAGHNEIRERRAVASHPVYAKPELLAISPNEVWSWDITKLKGPVKWTYYYLYVILDIFSRYVVGWMVAAQESATLAKRLITESCDKQHIVEEQLTLHADRGSSMKSKGVAQLLSDLGITKTHSRPHVSHDNPFSESQFKTMKYRPEYPPRFGCIQDARAFAVDFFRWYNEEHRHSGLALYTPADVHYGRVEQIQQDRQAALDDAYLRHPHRFVNKPPVAALPPQAVWINPPQKPGETSDPLELNLKMELSHLT
jgi:putative transposase